MSELNLTITIVFIAAIVLYSLSVIVILFTVIPLQIKEAFVKNGLHKLRTKMLVKGFLALTVAITSILILSISLGIDGDFGIKLILILLLINASGVLLKSVIDNKIYHEQYTPEAKKVHREVDKQERKAAKKQAKFDLHR